MSKSILEELSKHDKEWRRIAFYICKDKMLADDMVQDCYLKVKDYKKFNNHFISYVLYHIFIDHQRKEKLLRIDDLQLRSRETIYEFDDREQEIIDKYYKASWIQRELIAESYDRSLRDIEKEHPLINYGFAYREIQKGVKEILGEDYDKYNNSSMKVRKKKGKHK